jgi:hypothetical protein
MSMSAYIRLNKLFPKKYRSKKILEIGGSYNPIAPKSNGFNTKTVDHDTTENIYTKYKAQIENNTYSKINKVENVDYVWRGQVLENIIKERFDIIIASHVIEHIPDVLSFLISTSNLLNEKGIVSLAIPDKRFTFDYFRYPSEFGLALDNFNNKASKHSDGDVYNSFGYNCQKNGLSSWPHNDGYGKFKIHLKSEDIKKQMILNKSSYVDSHKWVFTPSSFKMFISESNKLGITSLKIVDFFETRGCEFIIHLAQADNQTKYVEDREVLIKNSFSEVCESYNQSKKGKIDFDKKGINHYLNPAIMKLKVFLKPLIQVYNRIE